MLHQAALLNCHLYIAEFLWQSFFYPVLWLLLSNLIFQLSERFFQHPFPDLDNNEYFPWFEDIDMVGGVLFIAYDRFSVLWTDHRSKFPQGRYRMIDHIPACMIIDCNFTAVYDNCQCFAFWCCICWQQSDWIWYRYMRFFCNGKWYDFMCGIHD